MRLTERQPVRALAKILDALLARWPSDGRVRLPALVAGYYRIATKPPRNQRHSSSEAITDDRQMIFSGGFGGGPTVC
jgi:hypothetical protein